MNTSCNSFSLYLYCISNVFILLPLFCPAIADCAKQLTFYSHGLSALFSASYCSVLLCFSDRTVKIWRARGGLDSTLDAADNADEVASN